MVEVQGVWVIAALSGNGALSEASQELMTPARHLAEQLGEPITVVLSLGETTVTTRAEQHANQLGANHIILLRHAQLESYQVEAYTAALSKLVQAKNPRIVFLDSAVNTMDYAPRLAVRTRGSLITYATEIDISSDRHISATRACYAEALLTQVTAKPQGAWTGPQFVTIKKKAFAKPQLQESPKASSETITPDLAAVKSRVERINFQASESKGLKKLEDADIVVSGGRGLKGPENFHWVEDLAALLGAAVGASRAVVDAGWRPHSEQVGQTGKSVSPKVYIALGISGALQHQVGMNSSQIIIAVNRDENAPIFKLADFGIVGDAIEIVPELIKSLEASRN